VSKMRDVVHLLKAIIIVHGGEVMLAIVNSFVRDESGQGMVEYALILAFVALAAIFALGQLGTEVVALLNKAVAAFSTGTG
jgi:pilus assembly protein Flp/PilA